jgi:CheY-like chemotaxis protein/HPt (histidine-containing phosphotransfer) domain-containing protein
LNLVGNAIKFTEKGHVRILVRCLGPHSLTPLLDFTVEDTGIGLTEEQRARLFRPFEQADASTTRKYGGTGLGLAICRSLAELLGGGIDVVSAPGSGSAFTLRIATGPLLGVPFVQKAQEALDGEPTLVQSAKMMIRLQGSILLAEDGADNQLLITTLLEKAGAAVTIAQNGKIAVEKVLAAGGAGTPYDVVLMDMQMPELDGYAATSRLRSEGYRGPIVALTAHAMAGDRAKCVAVGCDDYLTKPVDRLRLLTTVRAMLERAHDRAPAEPIRAAPEEPLVSQAADDEELGEALVSFTAALPSRATAMSTAEASEDWATLRTLSHQLKGAAGSFGYPSITDSCAEVEASVAAGAPADRTALQARICKLTSLCNRATATPPGRKCA